MKPSLETILWVVLLLMIGLLLWPVTVRSADGPPLPPGAVLSSLVIATNSAVAPPVTNTLPFHFWTRQSRGFTLASIATKSTNVRSAYIVGSTNSTLTNLNQSKWITNAEWNIQFSGFPRTQHLDGYIPNDGKSEVFPPQQFFWRVVQYQ